MDTFLFCLLATYGVACGLKFVNGEGDYLSPGLAVRQGEPTSVIAQKNGELLLNCSVQSSLGSPSISWQQDGGPVEIGKRIQLMSNGSLYFRRIIHRPKKSRSDEGLYDCIASLPNIGSIIARRVRVQVAGIEKKFDKEPQPQRVPVGGVAWFQCQIEAVPPAIYIWERNGTQLPQEDSRFIKLSSGILQIINVQEGDTGSYRCHATQGSLHELPDEVDNIYGKTSAEALLEVFKATESRPVKIHNSSRNVTARVGSTAVLECLVDGYSGAVQWKRESNGKVIELDNRIKRVENNLKFIEVELSDSGRYQCIAGQEIATLTLNVIAPPVLTKKPASEKYPKAKWIYIDCEADGSPKPTVTWLRNGQEVSINRNSFTKKGNKLVIVRADTSHSGFYQCLVENEAGFELAFGRLEITLQNDVPDPPENVRVPSVSKSEIEVVWDNAKTKPCCPVLAYTVHYSSGGEWKDEVTQNTHVTLKELQPFTNYSIYVMVYSSVGAGLASETIVVQTSEDVPSKPVTVTLEPQDTSILVKWDELPLEYRHGIITEYRLYYKHVSNSVPIENVEQGIPPSTRSFVIKNLEPATEYAVRMKAGTQVGFKTFQDSDWPWVPVRTRTLSGTVSPELHVVSINASAVNVTWSQAGVRNMNSFTIRLRNLSADEGTTVIKLPPETKHYVLSHLVTDAMYEVTLLREENDGNISITAVEFHTSDALLPPAPTNFVMTFSSEDTIGLEWYQPPSNMEILHYTVKYYELLNGDIPGVPVLQESRYNSILLEGLKPYTKYKMFVCAHTEKLISQYSKPVIGWTKEGVPSAPQDIKITSSKPGVVCIEWSPPAVPNGKITSYDILYSDQPDVSDDSWMKVTKNGTVNSAIISISDLAGKTYFFKLYASTQSGLGKPTNPYPLTPGVSYTEKTDKNTEKRSGPSEDQTLGILIGICIGVFCIIVCIIIILLRNKYFPTNQNQTPQTQPARFHGNGHIPGNGHAVPTRENPQAVGMYELETYAPMLDHLPENEHSDSKGGGGGNVILTPNGAKLNGFFPLKRNGMRNGQLPNGHMTSVLSSQYGDNALDAEETRGLIAAMIGGGHKDQPCLTGQVGEDSFTRGRYEDLGSLDDIDRSQEDISNTTSKISQGEIQNDGKNSQDESRDYGSSSSLSASGGEGNTDSLDCVRNRRSIPRSETTDTGDTVIFRGAAISSHDCCVTDRPQSLISGSSEPSGGEMPSADRELPLANIINDCSGAVLPRSSSTELMEEVDHYQVSEDGSDSLPQRSGVMHCGSDALPQKPQKQLSTSSNSRVLRSKVVKDNNIASDVSHTCNNSQCPPPSFNNREISSSTSEDRVQAAARHVHMNGGPHWVGEHSEQAPQGDMNLVAGTTRHNHIPHTSSPPRGGATTLAELPQDVKLSRSEPSSLKRHHYNV